MGRIADAIKKADAQRKDKLRLSELDVPIHRIEESSMLRDKPVPAAPQIVNPKPPLIQQAAPTLQPSSAPLNMPWEVHGALVAVTDKNCAITEQYRAVRTWLFSRMTPGERPCIAITSSMPREGKSVTTANLAAVLAEVRHMEILAVDCDFRQGSLAKLFNLPQGPGLAEVMSGRATLQEAIIRSPLGNLSILPAGSCADANPAELLNSRTTFRIFEEIRERYQYVLVDTPPVQRLSDVGVIGPLCSGVVMVVRLHKTASNLVKQSVRWLQSNNIPVVGCIASACRHNVDRYAYGTKDSDD